jgi:hypothetical protein
MMGFKDFRSYKVLTKYKALKKTETMMKDSKQVDLLNMNVTWSHKDLELYDNRFGVGEATMFTTVDTINLAMGVIAHRTFYKMMKRLPGRAINQILYPHMVRAVNYFCSIHFDK